MPYDIKYESEDEIKTVNVVDIYKVPKQREIFLNLLNEKGQVIDHEIELVRKDGSTFWSSLSATSIIDAVTGDSLIDGIIKDITIRHGAQQAQNTLTNYLRAIAKTTSLLLITAAPAPSPNITVT